MNKPLGNHPIVYYGNTWMILKIILVVLIIVGLIFDFFIPFSSILIPRGILIVSVIVLLIIIQFLEFIWFKKKKDNVPSTSLNNTFSWYKVWELYKHADNLYHQRFNFFLVAESMLVVSFATTLLVSLNNTILYKNIDIIRIGIAILGMIFTLSWFYVNKRLDWRLVFLNNEYLTQNEDYKKYIKSTDNFAKFQSGFFLSNLLPISTFVFWYFLFYLSRWQFI